MQTITVNLFIVNYMITKHTMISEDRMNIKKKPKPLKY